MPTHKHVADGEEMAREPANAAAAPETTGVTEDIHVVWRKKETAQPSTPADTTQPRVAAEGGEDWEARFQAEQARADDYLGRWQRAAADMANMRRRHELDRQEFLKQANAALIESLLPVLDSFDNALATIPEDLRSMPWVDGVILVERQLRSVLQRAGLNPIEAQGKPFDPNEHEALMHEQSDQAEDTVTGELQRGYKLHDRVLRPARVKVAKG